MKIIITRKKIAPRGEYAFSWDDRIYIWGYMVSIYLKKPSLGKVFDIRL